MGDDVTYFHLLPPSEPGKLLTVDQGGRLRYHRLGFDDISEYDSAWSLVTPPPGQVTTKRKEQHGNGFHIVSSRHQMALDYDQTQGEQVLSTPYHNLSGTHTIWHVSPDSEIYTLDRDGERKYLWPILDGVYVTHDEHLAERWTAISLDGHDIALATTPPAMVMWPWLVLFLVIFLFGVLYLRHRAT